MNIAVAAITIFLLCMLSVLSLGKRFNFLKRSYYFGINIWSRWVPVLGTATFIMILGANVVGGRNPLLKIFDLGSTLTFPELVVLFLVGPLFFSGAGSLLAAGTVVYLVERLLIDGAFHVGGSWLLLIGSTTTVAILADRLPWIPENPRGTVNSLIREVLVVALSFAALGTIFAAIFKAPALALWARQSLALPLHSNILLMVMGLLLAGWFTIVMGVTRHFTLPIVCLPSILVTAFITRWPSYILVVPMTICIALSLAVADRRRAIRT